MGACCGTHIHTPINLTLTPPFDLNMLFFRTVGKKTEKTNKHTQKSQFHRLCVDWRILLLWGDSANTLFLVVWTEIKVYYGVNECISQNTSGCCLLWVAVKSVLHVWKWKTNRPTERHHSAVFSPQICTAHCFGLISMVSSWSRQQQQLLVKKKKTFQNCRLHQCYVEIQAESGQKWENKNSMWKCTKSYCENKRHRSHGCTRWTTVSRSVRLQVEVLITLLHPPKKLNEVARHDCNFL